MRLTYRANPTWSNPPHNWRVFQVVVTSANQVVRMTPHSEALSKAEATTRAKRLNYQRRQEAVR